MVGFPGGGPAAVTLPPNSAPYAGNNCTLGMVSFLGAADHWLGVLAGITGRYTVAVQHLKAALARHRGMRSRPWTALTQEAYGRVLTRRGEETDIERARLLTRSAMRTVGEFGLAAILDRPACGADTPDGPGYLAWVNSD